MPEHAHVAIVEVGPRDGLQNEAAPVPTAAKVAFIERLAAAGCPVVEATSFVNPKAVPQMADAAEVMQGIQRRPGVRYLALVPNERGLDRALAAGVDAIALFSAATEAFAQANVGTSIDGTFERFAPVVERARAAGCWIRGYVSVALGCPYSGPVEPEAAVAVAERLLALGCDEIALGDTIGSGSPDDTDRLLRLPAGVPPVGSIINYVYYGNTGFGTYYSSQPTTNGVRTSFKILTPLFDLPTWSMYNASAGLTDVTFFDPFAS